jgi:hypothetical protein
MLKNKGLSSDLFYLLAATFFFGAAGGILSSTLNNYLSDVHSLGASGRGWLELPRELPGFLIMFVSAALLSAMRETRMASVAMLLTGAGALGLGFVAKETVTLVLFTIIWSMGDHIIFAVESPIGLNLARQGAEGRRLGQVGGVRNLGLILGLGVVYLLAKIFGDRYDLFYLVSAIAACAAGVFAPIQKNSIQKEIWHILRRQRPFRSEEADLHGFWRMGARKHSRCFR